MGIVNETVQDGVGIGRIADYFVPSVYWKLGGNHRGAASVAFLEDFQKIVTGGGVERLQAPVIENEQIGAAQVAQKTRMASVATPQGEGLEEPGHALIEDRAVVATRLVAERRGQPALADAGSGGRPFANRSNKLTIGRPFRPLPETPPAMASGSIGIQVVRIDFDRPVEPSRYRRRG